MSARTCYLNGGKGGNYWNDNGNHTLQEYSIPYTSLLRADSEIKTVGD
jgi:hypothetical protein